MNMNIDNVEIVRKLIWYSIWKLISKIVNNSISNDVFDSLWTDNVFSYIEKSDLNFDDYEY